MTDFAIPALGLVRPGRGVSEWTEEAGVPFSRKTKMNVRKRAWFACCICRRISLSLEVHHIRPETAGGSDLEENAAPLCASCHRSFGGNADHRARIGEMRDHWYKACRALFRTDSDPDEVYTVRRGDSWGSSRSEIATEEMSRTGTDYWTSAPIADGSASAKRRRGDCQCCRLVTRSSARRSRA